MIKAQGWRKVTRSFLSSGPGFLAALEMTRGLWVWVCFSSWSADGEGLFFVSNGLDSSRAFGMTGLFGFVPKDTGLADGHRGLFVTKGLDPIASLQDDGGCGFGLLKAWGWGMVTGLFFPHGLDFSRAFGMTNFSGFVY